MGLTARTATLAAACVLALAAFVTTTSEGALWSWEGTSEQTETESPDGSACEGKECEKAQDDGVEEPSELEVPLWLDTLSNLMLVLLAALFLKLVLRRLQLIRRAKLVKGRRETLDPPDFADALASEAELLADELTERLAALAGGSPRNAIVAAWIALESAAERAGIVPMETETPTEFTSRALARYQLDPDALQRLADLYREARFSRHRLTEHHLTQARDCLTVLTDDLRRAVPRTAGSTP